MRRSIFLIGLIISLVSCNSKPAVQNAGSDMAKNVAETEGKKYLLEKNVSQLNWEGSKPTGEHNGSVAITEGTVNIKEGKIVGGYFVIDLNTITNIDLEDEGMNTKLVNHLKSADFFDVVKYPTAKFEIVSVTELTEVSSAGDQEITATHQVTGNLEMKDISKSISFPASIDFSNSEIKAVSTPFVIDRTQWGVNYQSKSIFAELKDKFISDDMIISFNLAFENM